MVISRQVGLGSRSVALLSEPMDRQDSDLVPPKEIGWRPQGRHLNLPVEVLERSDVLGRIEAREISSRERVQFHQLLICTGGDGTHIVDFEPMPLVRGTIQRIYPGQVQQYVTEGPVDVIMVIWPSDSDRADPELPPWYPGSGAATHWAVDDVTLAKVIEWGAVLRVEQAAFDGSARRVALMRSLLRTFLLRLALELPAGASSGEPPPQAYIDFRVAMERQLHERPTVTSLALALGYSTRTLDRACVEASGHTAKYLLDERVALEVRRLLTYSNRSVAQIATSLGFADASNFSKFVKRQLGEGPLEIRAAGTAAENS